jgi:hypothetical protein
MSGLTGNAVHGIGCSDGYSFRIKRSLASSFVASSNSVGPGTQLFHMLKFLGVRVSKGCLCVSLQAEMNELGPQKCLQQKDRILRLISENLLEMDVCNFLQVLYNLYISHSSKLNVPINRWNPLESLYVESVARSARMLTFVAKEQRSISKIQVPTTNGPQMRRTGCCGNSSVKV